MKQIQIKLIALVFLGIGSLVHSQATPTTEASPFSGLISQIKQLEPIKPVEALQAQQPLEPIIIAPPTQTAVQTASNQGSGTVEGCGDNELAHFIYMHESGCRTNAVNAGGCAGIGQACPGSKLPCSLYDYPCQNAFFTAYANSAYGGWQGAYNFWLGHSWW